MNDDLVARLRGSARGYRTLGSAYCAEIEDEAAARIEALEAFIVTHDLVQLREQRDDLQTENVELVAENNALRSRIVNEFHAGKEQS